MLLSYTINAFPHEYVPTVFDNYSGVYTTIFLTDKANVWETLDAQSVGYSWSRGLCPFFHLTWFYCSRSVETFVIPSNWFLLCFDVTRPNSFDNIIRKWLPEIMHHIPICCAHAKKLEVSFLFPSNKHHPMLKKLEPTVIWRIQHLLKRAESRFWWSQTRKTNPGPQISNPFL